MTSHMAHTTVEKIELHHTAEGNIPGFSSSCFLSILYIMCLHVHKQNRRDSRSKMNNVGIHKNIQQLRLCYNQVAVGTQ